MNSTDKKVRLLIKTPDYIWNDHGVQYRIISTELAPRTAVFYI